MRTRLQDERMRLFNLFRRLSRQRPPQAILRNSFALAMRTLNFHSRDTVSLRRGGTLPMVESAAPKRCQPTKELLRPYRLGPRCPELRFVLCCVRDNKSMMIPNNLVLEMTGIGQRAHEEDTTSGI